MPYAPATPLASASASDYTGGRDKANAIMSVGQSVTQGMKQWYANDKQDTLTRSQVAALLPTFADHLTNPEDKKTVEKFVNHKSNYKDNAYLLGLFSTLKSQGEDKAKQDFVQAQTQLLQQQQAAAQRAAVHQQFLQNVGNGNTSMYPTDPTQNPLIMQAAQLYKATGQSPTPDNLLDYSAKLATAKAGPTMKVGIVHSTDAKGNPIQISVNQLTGEELGRAPVIPQAGTPQQQAETASLTEQAKKTADAAQTFLTDVSDNAESARVRGSSIKRINALYDAGAQTGFAQGQLTGIQAAMNRVGLAKNGLADQQQLNKELSNLALETARELMKGGGSVSNYERSLIQDATANPSLDPQANRQILKVMAAIADRAVVLDRKRQELDEQGVQPVVIARELKKLRDSIPVGMEALGANPADAILAKHGITPK